MRAKESAVISPDGPVPTTSTGTFSTVRPEPLDIPGMPCPFMLTYRNQVSTSAHYFS
jgi:hypothetical protein